MWVNKNKKIRIIVILSILLMLMTGCVPSSVQPFQILSIAPDIQNERWVVVTERVDIHTSFRYGTRLQLFDPKTQKFTDISSFAYFASPDTPYNIYNNLCVNTITGDVFYFNNESSMNLVTGVVLIKNNIEEKSRSTVSQGYPVIGTGDQLLNIDAIACDDVRNMVYVLGGEGTTLTAVDVMSGNRTTLFTFRDMMPKDITINSARSKLYILARSTQDLVLVYDIETGAHTQLAFNGLSPAIYVNYYKIEDSLLVSTADEVYSVNATTGESTVRYTYVGSRTPALNEVQPKVSRVLNTTLVDARQFNVEFSRALINLFPAPGDSSLIKVVKMQSQISYLYRLNLSTNQVSPIESKRILNEYPSILFLMNYYGSIAKLF